MNYEPDAQTIKDLISLVYLRFLYKRFVWKDIPDHDPHILPTYELLCTFNGKEKKIVVDKDWFDDSLLSEAFRHIISVDSIG